VSTDVLVQFEDVSARLLRGSADLADALDILDEAERRAGAPLVDEAERTRLEVAVAGDRDLEEHHHAVLAHREGACIGYAGLVIPAGDTHGVGDLALQDGVERCSDVLRALLEAIDVVARQHDAHGTEMWIRQARSDDVVAAVAAGYAVHRRLAVLGRSLEDVPATADAHDDVTIRSATAADVDEVVDVLAAAYAGAPEDGWDRDRFEQHAAGAWFRFEDLLVAEAADGGLLGVHWTKRRDDTTGEVYNLAVAPSGQGRRIGRRLLDAGLRHLAEIGCDEALLWVDLANEAAVRLYVTAGFTTRWEDVALLRHVRSIGRHDHGDAGHGPRVGH
jgi:mycothiol synthase